MSESLPEPALLSAESAGFLQPWMSSTSNTIELRVMDDSTAIFIRARDLFFWSKNTPLGRNGFGLFIDLARVSVLSLLRIE